MTIIITLEACACTDFAYTCVVKAVKHNTRRGAGANIANFVLSQVQCCVPCSTSHNVNGIMHALMHLGMPEQVTVLGIEVQNQQ